MSRTLAMHKSIGPFRRDRAPSNPSHLLPTEPRSVRLSWLVGFLVAGAFVCLTTLESSATYQRIHRKNSWSDYGTGTQVRLQTCILSYDQGGILVQEDFQRIVQELVEKNDEQLTFRFQSEIEIDGQPVPGESTQSVVPLPPESDNVAADGEYSEGVLDLQTRTIKCQIRRHAYREGNRDLIRVEYVSAAVYPYVLRREIRAAATDDQPEIVLKKTEVIELGVPEQILGEPRLCALVRTTEFHQGRSMVKLETMCPDIPGELVRLSSVERDEDGRVLRRVSTELVEFDVALESDEDSQRRRILGRIFGGWRTRGNQ